MIAVICKSCGHTQLYPQEYDVAFYEEDGQVNNVVKHYGTPQKTVFDHSFVEAKRRRLRFGDKGVKLSEEMRLLDIGGGYGFFGGEMTRAYPQAEITVLEPSRIRTEIGAAQMVENGMVPPCFEVGILDQPYADAYAGHFDVVTLWHVLEHVLDPVELIRLTLQIVKPTGSVCIEVPNLCDDTISLSPAFRDRSFMQEHISYFTPATLVDVAKRADPQATGEVHGYQRYGIFNWFHWIHFNKPQGASPDLFQGEDRFWLEAHWRAEKERSLTSDALFMVLRRQN
jgi:2-polyprenyl-3-methyl-5-hydroxy-6-metoxy-1,4-benzoquinol methylase